MLLVALQGLGDVLIEASGKGCAWFFFVWYVKRWKTSLVIRGPKVASAWKERPIRRTVRPEGNISSQTNAFLLAAPPPMEKMM